MAFFQSLVEFIETVFLSSNPDVKMKLDIRKLENDLKMIKPEIYKNGQLLEVDTNILYLRGSMNEWGTSTALVKKNGVASITIDDELVVHDIKIINGKDGYFLSMPNKFNKEGNTRSVL